MKKFYIILSSLAALTLLSCSDEKIKMPWEDDLNNKDKEDVEKPAEAKVGEPLPGWSEGCLDIHLINSGRGECLFHILPDGTTLLIDAGEIADEANSVPQKPNTNTRPYMVDARYIKHFLPKGKTAIDWCAPSHLHIDHIGSAGMAQQTSPNGYRLSGLLALYDEVPYDNVLDFLYPDYEGNYTIDDDGQLAPDWEKFVKWGVSAGKFKADRFKVGERQITLVNNKDKYDNFTILNICGDADVVKVNDDGSYAISEGTGKGNARSCGIHLKYGKFDYVTAGDLASAPQNRFADYVAAAINPGGLDVFKGNHHLNSNAWGSGMQKTAFSPRVIINQNFGKTAPHPALIQSIFSGVFANNTYSWTKDIFTTNLHPEAITENPGIDKCFTGYNGHIVVRVAPGGDEYFVYMLDDTNFDYKVTSIHGPYKAK